MNECIQSRRLLSEILLQLSHLKFHKQFPDITNPSEDGKSNHNVVIVAATNRLEDLDEAIIRRFDKKVYVGAPELSTRLQLVGHFLEGLEVSINETELNDLAKKTCGWSGSDIEVIILFLLLIITMYSYSMFMSGIMS